MIRSENINLDQRWVSFAQFHLLHESSAARINGHVQQRVGRMELLSADWGGD
jgi:hypothetical protein